MKISTTVKNNIIIYILASVGALFVFKYGFRIINTNLIYLIVLIYIISYLVLITFLSRFDLTRYSWASSQHSLLAAFTILIIGAAIIVIVLPNASRVTRYSAIIEWIERLLLGKFPWGNQTQFNPSGLPFLFIFALPFYHAGNIGILEIVGVILFCIALVQFYTQPHARWLPLFALVLLPSFYYELVVRSELFFNMTLIIVLIGISERYLDTSKLNFWFFSLATLFGLGLATRTIVGLVYAGYYAYKFRQQVFYGILFSGFTLMIFGFTLMPFVIWNAHYFLEEGPFSVQMGYLPAGITAIFVIIATIVGWKSSSIKDVLFSEGILLFVVVVIAFLSTVARLGIYTTIIKDGFDISYFIFCIPFLLLSLEKQQILGISKTAR